MKQEQRQILDLVSNQIQHTEKMRIYFSQFTVKKIKK